MTQAALPQTLPSARIDREERAEAVKALLAVLAQEVRGDGLVVGYERLEIHLVLDAGNCVSSVSIGHKPWLDADGKPVLAAPEHWKTLLNMMKRKPYLESFVVECRLLQACKFAQERGYPLSACSMDVWCGEVPFSRAPRDDEVEAMFLRLSGLLKVSGVPCMLWYPDIRQPWSRRVFYIVQIA